MHGICMVLMPLSVLAACGPCSFTELPLFYDGQVNKDVYGQTCNNWNFTDSAQAIDSSHNFCRLWTGSSELVPWCYVGNYAKLSFCDTGSFSCPLCENPPIGPSPKPILTLPCRLPPTPRSDPRIVGGPTVTNYEYPFFATAYVRDKNGAFLAFGGSLIHPNYVLTPWLGLSFFTNLLSWNIYLGARAVQPGQIPDSQCFETHSLNLNFNQIHCHPLGDGTPFSAYDWCLIRLTTPSKYTPIRLLTPEALADIGEDLESPPLMLTILGNGGNFGTQAQGWDKLLHKAYVPVSDFASCAAYYEQNFQVTLDPDLHFCAGYQHNPQPPATSYGDFSPFDTGGPVFTHRKGEYWQVGTIAQQPQQLDGCVTPPAVYYRINTEKLRDWICSTLSPTRSPTSRPSKTPTPAPSRKPTKSPTNRPTKRPTKSPVTRSPTHAPTRRPTRSPSLTKPPTNQPTKKPTKSPTIRPTKKPTHNPTTRSPSRSPSTRGPTLGRPTRMPTDRPTKRPTKSPATRSPTKSPSTRSPTHRPTKRPTNSPATKSPTRRPSTRSPTSPPRPLCSYLFPQTPRG